MNFNGRSYYTFNLDNENELANDFKKIVVSIMDAFEKGYLKEVQLMFMDAKEENVLENYKIRIKYLDMKDENNTDFDLECAIEEFLGSFEGLETLVVFKAENVTPHFYLLYIDSITPSEYEPPTHDPSDDLDYKLLHSGTSHTNRCPIINLGQWKTNFHSLICTAVGHEFFNCTNDSWSLITEERKSISANQTYCSQISCSDF
ncbi:hypothetical protein FQA39_LY14744 [Lamprigera yunnana]|nr:hypothetical protein FQA39_LY14744 [Lamprigera yunnana]